MDVFNMFDTDGSGEIELDEIAKAFKTTGKLTDETRAQLKAHFDFMDSDGSGKYSYSDLLCRPTVCHETTQLSGNFPVRVAAYFVYVCLWNVRRYDGHRVVDCTCMHYGICMVYDLRKIWYGFRYGDGE